MLRSLTGFARLGAALTARDAAPAMLPMASSGIRMYAGKASQEPVYVVFGATGGIGSALSQRLLGQSGTRVVCASENKGDLEKLRQQHSNAIIHECDATDTQQVEKLIESVMKEHGGLHGVANCVGNVVARSPAATSLSDLDKELKINLHSAFNIAQAASKAMLNAGGGSIVLVSAAVAQVGLKNFEAMSASKAAVEGMMRSVAATYAGRGVRVNCVAPGLTRTGETQHMTEKPGTAEASKQAHPAKRFAEPSDIAGPLAFLLGPDSAFITGQVLAVDGGLTRLQAEPATGSSSA